MRNYTGMERAVFDMNSTSLKEFRTALAGMTNCNVSEITRISDMVRVDYESCRIVEDKVAIDCNNYLEKPMVMYVKTNRKPSGKISAGYPALVRIFVRL